MWRPHPAWAALPRRGAGAGQRVGRHPAGPRAARPRAQRSALWLGQRIRLPRGLHPSLSEASRYLVSNQEFAAFVAAGGYADDTPVDRGRRGLEELAAPRRASDLLDSRRWTLAFAADARRSRDALGTGPSKPIATKPGPFCQWQARVKPARRCACQPKTNGRRCAGFAGIDLGAASAGAARANIELDHYASACPVSEFAHGRCST